MPIEWVRRASVGKHRSARAGARQKGVTRGAPCGRLRSPGRRRLTAACAVPCGNGTSGQSACGSHASRPCRRPAVRLSPPSESGWKQPPVRPQVSAAACKWKGSFGKGVHGTTVYPAGHEVISPGGNASGPLQKPARCLAVVAERGMQQQSMCWPAACEAISCAFAPGWHSPAARSQDQQV
jgi:hypothetical protein